MQSKVYNFLQVTFSKENAPQKLIYPTLHVHSTPPGVHPTNWSYFLVHDWIKPFNHDVAHTYTQTDGQTHIQDSLKEVE